MTPQVVTDERETSTTPTGYLVSVNLSLTLIQMIEAGKYGNHQDAIADITEERFPVDRSRDLTYDKELFLVAPSRKGITPKEWKTELKANGWELEQTPEILAFGAKHPDLQLEHYIVAFGSSWRSPGSDVVSPDLWSRDGDRRASTHWCFPGHQWNLPHLALVSRKPRP